MRRGRKQHGRVMAGRVVLWGSGALAAALAVSAASGCKPGEPAATTGGAGGTDQCTAADSGADGPDADETITVDAASNGGSPSPLIGFVHGIAAPSGPDEDFPAATQEKIAALAPGFWKVSDARHYKKARSFNADVMYASSDEFFDYAPLYYPWNEGGTAAGTFDDWVSFDANEHAVLQVSLSQGQPVSYWGILNEPQIIKYSPKDQARIVQTFGHGYHDFKDGHPEQRVTAPTTIGYSSTVMAALLDYAQSNGLVFDAYDWHELGTRPEDVVAHVADLRSLLQSRPSLGNPPVIIDEYASPEEHLLPGFAVAWFYYLEEAGVLRASRACWDVTDSQSGQWSDCWNGLDGLFMKDNITPQALYWVFERYSSMKDVRLTTATTAPGDVVALARSGGTGGELRILAGRFVANLTAPAAAPKNVEIRVEHLSPPSGCVSVRIERIPYDGPDQAATPVAQPLMQPETVREYSAALQDGALIVDLTGFEDRDAYLVILSQP